MIKLAFIFALFSITLTDLSSNECHRNLYLGSPVNTIHKAHEYIEFLL